MGISFSSAGYSKQNNISDFKKANDEFLSLSLSVYKDQHTASNARKLSLDALNQKIIALQSVHDSFNSVQLIIANLELIKKNIDNKFLFDFIGILLKNNAFLPAFDLLQHTVKNADKSLTSNVKFIFAKYYFNKGDFAKSQQSLSGITSDLSIDNGHYASIMQGVLLQNIKKHRQSIQHYDSVPLTSKYYNYAQLNKAIVYIRQGWWTDAHLIINQLLISQKPQKNDFKEITNRLLLVAGYSFLQQEYFRESRKSFRGISINSKYANRALLGIALSAANQGDNTGALNILNVLQKKNINSLTVEETYLLLPYIYERVGQHKTSAASYRIGLSFYEKRINELQLSLLQIKKDMRLLDLNKILTSMKYNYIPLADGQTKHLLHNIRILKVLSKKSKTTSIAKKIKALNLTHKRLLTINISKSINKRIQYLQSYQNQSQFGIARLYDNSRKNKQ